MFIHGRSLDQSPEVRNCESLWPLLEFLAAGDTVPGRTEASGRAKCYDEANLKISTAATGTGSCSIRPDSSLRVVFGLRD